MGGAASGSGTEGKLDLLAESARYDVCLASCAENSRGGVGRYRDPRDPLDRWIYPAAVPAAGNVGILKVLQTNACANNCSYCALAASRDCVRRVTLAPEELAGAFMRIAEAGLAHGIFISSGVNGKPDSAMDRMIRTAEILRTKHRFGGYIHLKVLPGCSFAAVTEAARFATRLSVNLEAPTPSALSSIAPDKDFVRDLLLRMKWVGDVVKRREGASSQTTQFVVGAAGESDLDILRTVDWIYRELYVFRAYFSAYQPLVATGRGPGRPPPPGGSDPLLREHRLYQTDYLLRGYGFRLADIVFDAGGNIPREVDPKTAYALMHPELYPVDCNHAPIEDLLKVPGIGPVAARRIVEARQEAELRDPGDLRKIGRIAARSQAFLRFAGRADADLCASQKQLWLTKELGQGWKTGVDPLAKERIPEAAAGEPYAYAGQTGRRLHYASGTSAEVVRCR